jgi:hypothetical protein
MARTVFINVGLTEDAVEAIRGAKLSLTSPDTGTVSMSEVVLAALDIAGEDQGRFRTAVIARRTAQDQ